MNNKTALITGASGGFGLDFAHRFARDGHNVIIVARSKDKLESIAAELSAEYGIIATPLVYDLTDPTSPQKLYDDVTARDIQVDFLVNNAGFAAYGEFYELDLERQTNMIQINITTLTHLTRLFLPQMIERQSGKVLNVASTAAFMPGPLMAVYYASKSYVLSFTEALAKELENTGVTATVLCPGPTATGFQSRADMENSKLVQGNLMRSEDVVNQGYEAMMNARAVYIPGWMNRIQAMLPRFLPRGAVRQLVYSAQGRVS